MLNEMITTLAEAFKNDQTVTSRNIDRKYLQRNLTMSIQR